MPKSMRCLALIAATLTASTDALATPPTGGGKPNFNEIASTSSATKGLVSSLTAVVNALGGSQEDEAQRERQFESLTPDAVLSGLRRDFVDNEYLWSGKITPELYGERCVFTDPTLSFSGLSTFEKNLENLDPWINRFVPSPGRAVDLKSIELVDGDAVVEATWTMRGDLALPWRPRLELDGRTRFTLGGEGGRISSYDEAWAIEPAEALAQLVRPNSERWDDAPPPSAP